VQENLDKLGNSPFVTVRCLCDQEIFIAVDTPFDTPVMSYTDRIRLLKLYTMALPDALPMEQPDDKINKLLGFELDAEWVASIGELAAVNRELENAIWGYGGPRSDDGIFKITTRGPAIQNLADILEYWLAKYPDAFQLQKWLQDATASASAIILAHKKPVRLNFRLRCTLIEPRSFRY
jgi:hypothetical protein